jgi:hypothetical protein
MNNFALMILIPSKQLKRYNGATLCSFLFEIHKGKLDDFVFIDQENIYVVRQKELVVILFYLWYEIDYSIQIFKFKNHSRAYRNRVFEREACFHENHLEYLKNRKPFSFLKMYCKTHVHGVTF